MIERSGERNLSALPYVSTMGKHGFRAEGAALACAICNRNQGNG